jgi:hypothetical protein
MMSLFNANLPVKTTKKIDLFFLTAVNNPPAFSCRWKIKTSEKNAAVSPLPQKPLSAIMYFFATSRTED